MSGAYIPPPDHARLHKLFADPHCASQEEIRHMAEELDRRRRSDGQKTLHDEFAMAALTGLLRYATLKQPGNDAALAALAYDHADAMMEARKK